MSAENAMQMYRMANGEVWIGTFATGDTELYAQNAFQGVIAKCATYEEAVAQMNRFADQDSSSYVYTEYGPFCSSKEQFECEPTHFLASCVMMVFGARSCGCLDGRDVLIDQWKVIEKDCSDGWWKDDATERVLHANLPFAQALTFAHLYAQAQPGEASFTAPTHFLRFPHHPEHRCHDREEELDLPVR